MNIPFTFTDNARWIFISSALPGTASKKRANSVSGPFAILSESNAAASRRPVAEGEDISAAAIIHDADGNVLLQLREEIPKVAFGGYWGLFGGRVEIDETPLTGLARELEEELSIMPGIAPALFSTIAWNGGGLGPTIRTRHYFLVPISPLVLSDFKLGEGADMAIAKPSCVPSDFSVMPHDHLALSMFWGTAYARNRPRTAS